MWALLLVALRIVVCNVERDPSPVLMLGGSTASSTDTDPRVTNFEKINARYVEASQLPLKVYDFIVMDLSFISLKKVLPNIWKLLANQGDSSH